ncbi:putative transcriptional regulator, LysR family [Pseudonocardia sp. Ae406_Ps2]|uniref:LysR family transcriptional regulator n=1 Tax=unclassified Pseudonocardia TaxID=2619320 RepID=UPI00094B7466|nr:MULTISPECIES: LysR family transcriptional regulator [unclassified Pseudonocardia]OLM01039.1 putative transcriptional regulator, LysR family [Pseudonocardia sp. Ae406_Ps2]OLM07166.1 putative transcriptional regulator, LysR family [Pseudonocardia sp. Ae331_Ps2]OLM22617.1 putative transcriptional regulator, LysR family [Pseudonocardia sp. Ae706_Ps2]OLM31522.1 putative transcriptional regulator, LysR family [Pseudonocardia sp. Ae717_Ps2]
MATAPARVPDLTALALLRDIACSGSMATAAEGLGLTVQAASARIRAAEQQAGGPVLERGRRGRRSSSLTTRGVLLVEWAGPLLAAAADLDVAVAALRDEPAGEDAVVLAANPVVAECLLQGWLVELRDGPGGRVVLRDTADPAAAVRSGDAAVGVVSTPGPLEDLHAATVASDPLVLVVAPGHPWSAVDGVDATELAGTPLLTRPPGAGARPALEAALDAAGAGELAAPRREYAADAALRAAVRAGAGPAVLGRAVVAADVAAGSLVVVDVRGLDLTREFRAVWREGTSPRGTARDLLRIATGGRIR